MNGALLPGYCPAVRRLALGVAVLSALAAPGLARGELLPGTAGARDSALAVAADGSPVVAFVDSGGAIRLATRSADGIWSAQAVPLAADGPDISGLAVGPHGVALLSQPASGVRIDLAERSTSGWRVRTIARRPKNGLLGFGGLALDAAGRPLVAYAQRLSSRKSSLRLVHETAAGRLVTELVTKKGFPSSSAAPVVAPVVLPSGAVRIVEAISGAAIEWSRTKNGKDWAGQFLYANPLAEPAGVMRAAASPGGGVWSAWTDLFQSYDESHVVAETSPSPPRTTVLHRHAFVAGLAPTPAGPEVAADDYVNLEGARTVLAGLILDPTGGVLELGGDLQGYALDAAGGRQYLFRDAPGVSWYRAAAPPTPRVTLTAAVDGASFLLAGRVTGAPAGATVELWRETQAGAELLATLPLAADGTFSATDVPPARPLTYRAVYRDPSSGLPVAALVRDVLGA
jgi:hypothetical protein